MAISPGAPQQSPWFKARAIEADKFAIDDAYKAGTELWGSSTPHEAHALIGGLESKAERDAFQWGAREGLRKVMGAAT